jgi:transcription elongation factor Elf1
MTCPVCGAEMNLHAEKLVQPVTPEEAESVTTVVDGVLEIVFACPQCGRIESRREPTEDD